MNRLSRRRLLTAAGLLGVTGCDATAPREGFLGAMERWNAGDKARVYALLTGLRTDD